jgi:threonine/homoserine/homoserine lactone efflux protein
VASVLGIHTGSFVHIGAAAVGVSAALAASATAFTVVKWAGALYLIVLGVRTLARRDAEQDRSGGAPERSLRRTYTDGIVVNVLNPKTALFFLAFLPQFVDPDRGPVTAQVLVLGLVFVLLGICSDGLYALAASAAGDWLRARPHLADRQRIVSGVAYLGLGVAAAVASGPSEHR